MLEDVATLEPSKLTTGDRKKVKSDGDKQRESTAVVQRETQDIYCTSFDSRIGRIYVASTERGVCKISVPKESRKDFFSWLDLQMDLEGVVDNKSRNRDVMDQLSRYFNGRLVRFTCPVDLIGTP